MANPVSHHTTGLDLTDPDLILQGVPAAEFARLRRSGPVAWNTPRAGFEPGDGFWAVTRHADVRAVSANAGLFSSAANTAILDNRVGPGGPGATLLMLNMDPPDHSKLRRIVQRGFTPRAVAKLEEALRERADRIVRTAAANGSGDFVTEVAAELPLQAIADLIGIPQSDRRRIFEWTNQMVGFTDPEFASTTRDASLNMLTYAVDMAGERRADPDDTRTDIVSTLLRADIDGRGLSDDEFGFFVLLLAVAGNETTRNAITHGMVAFLDEPAQWELFRQERPESAADEVVRWATPVIAFQRTAMADTELAGQAIKAGERVGMFYSSANFDEEVFDEPHRFDVTRSPNPHLGFGGTGPHYCLGANLALLEIRLMFGAIADHMPGITRTGEPSRLRHHWINGVKHLPVRYA